MAEFQAPKGVRSISRRDRRRFSRCGGPGASCAMRRLWIHRIAGVRRHVAVRAGVGLTDVVSKEMYTFLDRGDGPCRCGRRDGGSHAVDRREPTRQGRFAGQAWYAGPFFRAERPQHGRYRQLQQVGLEAVGSDDPALDAEVIAIADEGIDAWA